MDVIGLFDFFILRYFMSFLSYFSRKFYLSSTTLIALVALYFTVILDYPFYRTVLKYTRLQEVLVITSYSLYHSLYFLH